MFALFINPETQMPTTVNTKSRSYAELKSAGYTEVLTGGKSRMEDKQKELLDELGIRDIGDIEND